MVGGNSMIDFKTMSIKELKVYLKTHKGDTEAFHELMDRLAKIPQKETYGIEDLDKLGELIQKHRESTQG